MNLDNFKLQAPPTQGFLKECETCNKLFDTSESRAEDYERFCSTSCESQQDDPGDSQNYVDNQDK